MTADGPRAVVADDSRFMRGLITEILEEGGVRVVGEAADGQAAVALVAERRPDVVTMDVEMPRVGGLEAVERIMAETPTPVLMLSAYTEGDADVTLEALDRGAVDFFAKPGGEVSMGVSRLRERLVAQVVSVAGADLTAGRPAGGGRPASADRPVDAGPSTDGRTAGTRSDNFAAGSRTAGASAPAPASASPTVDAEADVTVVVGASTGGPNAVERVLAALPAAAALRVLVVQHMPAAFTRRFAERLDAASEYDVREATDGARVGGGEALVAAGGSHMQVTHYRNGRLRVGLTDDDLGENVRPAVDVTMRSAAETVTDPLVGVVLTGMGADGAAGVEAIHAAGGRTLAQDEATSVVYGMPKRAFETGCVDEVVPIDRVAAGIVGEVA